MITLWMKKLVAFVVVVFVGSTTRKRLRSKFLFLSVEKAHHLS